MPVHDPTPITPEQRRAATAMLAAIPKAADDLGRLFARNGHELSLVGGPVQDIFLRRQGGDLDLTTDARPERVIEITSDWADTTWSVGIAFGTVGLRKGDTVFEITTYRTERYDRTSRKPAVSYGKSLVDDLMRRDFTVNAMAVT